MYKSANIKLNENSAGQQKGYMKSRKSHLRPIQKDTDADESFNNPLEIGKKISIQATESTMQMSPIKKLENISFSNSSNF